AGGELPDAPGSGRYPDAQLVAEPDTSPHAQMRADTSTESGGRLVLDGGVRIEFQGRTLMADHIEFDGNTGDATLSGHVVVLGGRNDERIEASHASMNLHTATGRFYDVSGSVGLRAAAPGKVAMVYDNGNPFRFTGRVVTKTGPETYVIENGTLTSCQLPRPDWQLAAGRFRVDGSQARATNSVFYLLNVPLLYLPYVTHPVDSGARQSGLLIPVATYGGSRKGLELGEKVYWALNRSADLMLGTVYYSVRGWSENGSFRYRGLGQDFVLARFSALQDRGYTPAGGIYTNQGGQEVTFSGRRDFTSTTRAVADVDYLSSFLYREGFADSFNQAVASDIVSTVYVAHAWNGTVSALEGDRYQGEKRVQSVTPRGVVLPEQEVHIFHAPALEFSTTDHRLGSTGLEWNVSSSLAGLKRTQPNFVSSGMVERLDVRPELALPFSVGTARVRPSVAVRETFYSRSRAPGTGLPPVESTNGVNRSSVEVQVEVRPPAVERTFSSGWMPKLLHHDVKHTVEPELGYKYVTGIDNFSSLLRFDAVDVASNTNELRYGVTQRLFLRRPGAAPCRTSNPDAEANANEVLGPSEADAQAMPEDGAVRAAGADFGAAGAGETVCGTRELISWRVAQKYFFDPSFGGAVVNGRRNFFETTLGFSGIAFATEARDMTPVISRLRVRTSEKTDLEWDFDYDTVARKFTADNVYLDVHQGLAFGGVSYSRLNAPGRSVVEGVSSAVADFSQMRLLLGFGKPTRAGLSAAANAGLDLSLAKVQYGALQVSYNWNCCGLSIEYRKYELGTARNENAYRFNFTLANIGTAGNLRHSQQVF
ncbi:MAG: LPS assembly protein LptD, partial [Acidobacteriota bacterium]|nr:LPS assembly protein LptD [Acidobacteriota bacterium]